jgi:hypothetical protein
MLNHVEASVRVYFSTEYGRFKMMNGNRQLNDGKIKRIIREISSGNDVLKYYPIQVRENNDRLDILDGQHRFYISKYLKRPVFYILVSEEKTMTDIAKINSNVEKWKAADYINCYVQQGNKNYEQLRDFMDTYNFVVSVSCKLLYYGNPGVEGFSEGISSLFQSGGFEVKHFNCALEIAEDCKRFSFFPKWRERSFIIAIYRIKQSGIISLDEIIAAIKKRPEMLTRQATYKEYIWNLEQIINMGKQKRVVLI